MTNKSLQSALILAITWVAISGDGAFAQNIQRYRPPPLPALPPSAPQLEVPIPPATGSDKVLLKKLDALVVVDRPDRVDPTETRPDARGLLFEFANQQSLVYSASFRSIVDRYIDQPLSLLRLNELSREIIELYIQHGQPVVDVLIPEQKITGGTVQIVIIEARIGLVRVQEGRFFDACETSRWIEYTRPGGPIYEPWLDNDLFWLNQNPFRKVGVDLKPGAKEGLTDIIFTVDDVFPVRGYVGYDNTGVRALGMDRFSAGFTVGNAFGGEEIISYQYTTDANFSHLQAHTVTFAKPINRDYTFLAFGSWAGLSPIVATGFNQNGESYIAGFDTIRTLRKNRYVNETLIAGFNFKSTNNNLEFGGSSVFGSVADLDEIHLGYQYREFDDHDQFQILNIDTWIGPGSGFTPDNTAAAFSSVRPDTKPEFIYARMSYQQAYNLGDHWQLTFRGTGQLSPNRLLYSETLGFGGYDSIRGYDQRTASGDNGWFTNLELGIRPVPVCIHGQEGRLRYYVFSDSGESFILYPQPGEYSNQFLTSAGVGLRLSLAQNLSFRFDYGHNFTRAKNYNTLQRVHLGLIWQFGPLP